MIDSSPPPPPSPNDGTDHSTVEPTSPKGEDGGSSGSRAAGSWLRSRRSGQMSSYLPLHLDETFLVHGGVRDTAGGLVRFRIPGVDEAGPSRRSRWRRTDLGHQLAGSEGELRLIRSRPRTESAIQRAPIAMLTLNGITDAAPPIRLDIAGPSPAVAGEQRGRTAGLGVDVHFFAGLWDLALPEHTRRRLHLEGPVRVLPDWPTAR